METIVTDLTILYSLAHLLQRYDITDPMVSEVVKYRGGMGHIYNTTLKPIIFDSYTGINRFRKLPNVIYNYIPPELKIELIEFLRKCRDWDKLIYFVDLGIFKPTREEVISYLHTDPTTTLNRYALCGFICTLAKVGLYNEEIGNEYPSLRFKWFDLCCALPSGITTLIERKLCDVVKSKPALLSYGAMRAPRVFNVATKNGFKFNRGELQKILTFAISNGSQAYVTRIIKYGYVPEYNDVLTTIKMCPRPSACIKIIDVIVSSGNIQLEDDCLITTIISRSQVKGGRPHIVNHLITKYGCNPKCVVDNINDIHKLAPGKPTKNWMRAYCTELTTLWERIHGKTKEK